MSPSIWQQRKRLSTSGFLFLTVFTFKSVLVFILKRIFHYTNFFKLYNSLKIVYLKDVKIQDSYSFKKYVF